MVTLSTALSSLPSLTGLALSLAGVLVLVVTVLTIARPGGPRSRA